MGVVTAAFASRAAAADRRPNFLVILCDDLGYGDLACYGHPDIKTPHLDRLAGQGIRLTDCYASAPVCSPSRAGLLTGRTPSRVGVYDWIPPGNAMHLAKEEVTVATLLKQAGYTTCHVGKWHCNGKFNSPDQPQPGDHGFDHWFSTQNNASPTHKNPKNFVRNGEAIGPLEGFSCGIVADEAIDWLRDGREKEKPFFQFVCFHEPHEPIDSPKELVDDYPQATKRGQALYYANVANMDRAVGRIMAALDELELTDNTLVFFTSDNGPETLNRYGNAWRSHGSPGKLRGMKLHLYEGGIRVPGILRFPGRIEPGKVLAEPISGVDVMPTLCALGDAKLPTDRQLDGTSFAPVFSGAKIDRQTPLYWHYFRALGQPKVAMRVDEWMILGHVDGPQGGRQTMKDSNLTKFELYNLGDDLSEARDLTSAEPERLKQLSALLVAKHREVQAEGRTWDTVKKAKKQP
jgi:arylsulfatase A